jgi:hypothetical protein
MTAARTFIIQKLGDARLVPRTGRGRTLGAIWHNVTYCALPTVAESVLQQVRTDFPNSLLRIHVRPARRV